MAREPPRIGSCPKCAAAIVAPRVLVEYRTPDGTRVFAECPSCREVVHPAADRPRSTHA